MNLPQDFKMVKKSVDGSTMFTKIPKQKRENLYKETVQSFNGRTFSKIYYVIGSGKRNIYEIKRKKKKKKKEENGVTEKE